MAPVWERAHRGVRGGRSVCARAPVRAPGRWSPPTPPPLRRSLGLYQDEEDEAGWWLVGWWVVCGWWWVAGGRPVWIRKMTVGGCGGWWWVVSGCPAPPHHVPKHCTYHPPPMFLRHVVGWLGGLWLVVGCGRAPCPGWWFVVCSGSWVAALPRPAPPHHTPKHCTLPPMFSMQIARVVSR